jgi:hypothetical protein
MYQCHYCGSFDAELIDPKDPETDAVCRLCNGDPDVDPAVDFDKHLGKNRVAFFEARIPIVADALNENNRAKFLGMSRELKFRTIEGLVLGGHIT